MKFKGLVFLVVLLAVVLLAGGAPAQEKVKLSSLWNGNQWTQLTYDGKAGYVFGVGNMADFETTSGKGKGAPISKAFAAELKTKTVGQIVDEVDNYYRENPTKKDTSVLEVILIRCTHACPPGLTYNK
jgi:hypothetical protein